MKRHGNLYPLICDMDNIRIAHENARKGKAHYSEVKMVDADPERYFREIHRILTSRSFVNSPYKVFTRQCAHKTREIYKLPYFPDRIIHHCIVQVLEPLWMAGFIPDTLACIKGRGIHKGVKKIKRILHEDPAGTRYCLKMDVKKFYPTIDHGILKQILSRKIKDPDVLGLLGCIIDSTEAGVPIGNYLSQYFGNIYLSTLDHWIKEALGCRYYIRYCDDMVILDGDKARLHHIRGEIEAYLQDRLNLALKSDWQVFPVAVRGIDFLGYRFFPEFTLLRKSTALQFKRAMQKLKARWRRMPPISVLSAVMSYYGWMKHANCRHLWNTYVDDTIRDIVGTACERGQIKNPLKRRYA